MEYKVFYQDNINNDTYEVDLQDPNICKMYGMEIEVYNFININPTTWIRDFYKSENFINIKDPRFVLNVYNNNTIHFLFTYHEAIYSNQIVISKNYAYIQNKPYILSELAAQNRQNKLDAILNII